MEAYSIIPEWNEIIFNEDVIVTDGIDVWIDAFDEAISGEVYLSGTGGNVDEVTAWMPLPIPYK